MHNPYNVKVTVISCAGKCDAGHCVGEEVLFDGESVKGHLCIHAMYSMLPKVFAMMYGTEFPWLADKSVSTHACPDARNPVVFEVRRIEKQ